MAFIWLIIYPNPTSLHIFPINSKDHGKDLIPDNLSHSSSYFQLTLPDHGRIDSSIIPIIFEFFELTL
jgi:hypothetical protein